MIVLLLVAALGLAVGSFLNVCLDRIPAGQSLLRPRSRCPACETTLAAIDLVPVLSFLLLRGKCRYCRAPIPIRVPFVEAGTGLLFVLLWLMYGASAQFPAAVSVDGVVIVAVGMALERRRCRGGRPPAPSEREAGR